MWSQLCVVMMCTMFCLYIINLKATVTLTFDRLISKSIGFIYTSIQNVCAKFEEPRSILCLLIIRARFGLYVNMLMVTVTLTFNQLTSKSIGGHLHPKMHVCAKFDKPSSILCLVIIGTRFGLYVNMVKVTVTLTFDRMSSKSIEIIYTPRHISVPNLRNLGQFCV